jgi:hypothetical protein
MSTHDTRKPSLDSILDGIRGDEPARAEIDAAAGRVRSALGFDQALAGRPASAHIESCAGFQTLIPDYLAGRLGRAEALLLEDHSRECIPCRRALIAARQPRAVAAAPAPGTGRTYVRRWAAAAAMASVALLAGYAAWEVLPGLTANPHLKVLRVDGSLYQLKDGGLVALRAGMSVPAKDLVRSAKDSGALLQLDDGSRVEMRDRTEFAVRGRRDGATIALGNGSIIVEASPQGSGHLDVTTEDCLVSVKGTIFAVNHGTKGSRVSVVEGSVKVDADGSARLLSPGDQVVTTDAVAPIAVSDEIAWSKDAERYTQLLHELASLRKDLDARVPNPKLRYASSLLDRMPDGTLLYAAIPNLTDSLVEAKKVFEEHVAQSEALQAWWTEHMTGPEQQKDMDEAFARLEAYGSQLGDEIVISLGMDGSGHLAGPVVTAEVKDPAAIRKMLVKDIKHAENRKELVRETSLTFDGNVMQLTHLRPGAPVAGATRWQGSILRDKLQQAYADGASWLFGVDLKTMISRAAADARARGGQGERVAAQWDRMGVLDAQYLVFKRTEGPDGAEHRAEISFDQPRRGVMGWLAAPAPLGAAEFVSPDAAFAAAAVLKRPEVLFGEILSWVGPDHADLAQRLSDADAEGGLPALKDLASTLGGDVAIALDGPVLPVPSWKLAVEVYDPSRFQSAFENLVAWANERIAARRSAGRIVVEREETGNRTDWVVRFNGAEAANVPMRYTYSDGYLIAAPSRALLDRAIEQRGNGYSLIRSKEFLALLPRDGQVNVSAAVWENLGPTIGPIAGQISGAVDSAQAREIQAMAAESGPHLLTAYAEDDRIVVASRGEAGLGSLLGSIVSAQNLGVLDRALEHARHARAQGAPATP